MIFRMFTLGVGLAAGLGLAQFPEFAQQYGQRLGGAVDALDVVVADFDKSANAAGLTREQALRAMDGSPFLIARQADMRATILRRNQLAESARNFSGAGPFMRAYHATRFTDRQTATAALRDFRPALPLGFDGLVFALAGFGLGCAAAGALGRLARACLRLARTRLRLTRPRRPA